MSTSAPDLAALLGGAVDDGTLSGASLQALNITNIGDQIMAGMGVNIDDVNSSEVIGVNLLIDDSGSISAAGHTDLLRDCANLVIDALAGSKNAPSILLQMRLMNGRRGVQNSDVISPFTPIQQATKLDTSNYDESYFGATPLYDRMVIMLGTTAAKAKEFSDAGVAFRSISLVVTDGADCGSQTQNARSVKTVVDDLLRQEIHIVAGFGIPDWDFTRHGTNAHHSGTDFNKVFKSMGIPERWTMTVDPNLSPDDAKKQIRAKFLMFSQSAVQASQSAGSFSQAAMGGFGATTP